MSILRVRPGIWIFPRYYTLERVGLYCVSVLENAQVKPRNYMKINKNGARSHLFF